MGGGAGGEREAAKTKGAPGIPWQKALSRSARAPPCLSDSLRIYYPVDGIPPLAPLVPFRPRYFAKKNWISRRSNELLAARAALAPVYAVAPDNFKRRDALLALRKSERKQLATDRVKLIRLSSMGE